MAAWVHGSSGEARVTLRGLRLSYICVDLSHYHGENLTLFTVLKKFMGAAAPTIVHGRHGPCGTAHRPCARYRADPRPPLSCCRALAGTAALYADLSAATKCDNILMNGNHGELKIGPLILCKS